MKAIINKDGAIKLANNDGTPSVCPYQPRIAIQEQTKLGGVQLQMIPHECGTHCPLFVVIDLSKDKTTFRTNCGSIVDRIEADNVYPTGKVLNLS